MRKRRAQTYYNNNGGNRIMGKGLLSLGLVFMCLIPALGVITAYYRIIAPDASFTMINVIPFQILLFGIGFLLIAESLFSIVDGE